VTIDNLPTNLKPAYVRHRGLIAPLHHYQDTWLEFHRALSLARFLNPHRHNLAIVGDGGLVNAKALAISYYRIIV